MTPADKRAIWNAAYGAAFALQCHDAIRSGRGPLDADGECHASEKACAVANAAVASLPDEDNDGRLG